MIRHFFLPTFERVAHELHVGRKNDRRSPLLFRGSQMGGNAGPGLRAA